MKTDYSCCYYKRHRQTQEKSVTEWEPQGDADLARFLIFKETPGKREAVVDSMELKSEERAGESKSRETCVDVTLRDKLYEELMLAAKNSPHRRFDHHYDFQNK